MTYITIKTKKIKANVEIFPPIVLDGRSHISLVDIRIPEEVTKSFTFTKRQAIFSEPIKGDQPKTIVFPKGDDYNIPKLQHMIKNNPLAENLSLNIETTNNNIYITTKSNTIKIFTRISTNIKYYKDPATF